MFRSIPELVKPIEAYITHHNDHGNGFTWTATAKDVLAKQSPPRTRGSR